MSSMPPDRDRPQTSKDMIRQAREDLIRSDYSTDPAGDRDRAALEQAIEAEMAPTAYQDTATAPARRPMKTVGGRIEATPRGFGGPTQMPARRSAAKVAIAVALVVLGLAVMLALFAESATY